VAVACVPLEHGADAIAQDKDGLTPFRMALGGRHGKVAHLLFRNGADAGAQDIMCRTDSGTYEPTIT
jgi:ankyrin repeat protein